MGKRKKSSKKSEFIKNIKALKEAVIYGKSSSETLPYSSREEYIETLFEMVMKKKDTRILRENL